MGTPTVPPDAPTVAPQTPTAPPVRIAVVDDDADIRLLLRLYLAATERATLAAEAHDAASALATLPATAPDVILLDHDLGATCGLTLIPTLHERCPRALVVILSSLPAEVAAASALEAGADAYYEKSVLGARLPASSLLDRLQGDLDRRRAAIGAHPSARVCASSNGQPSTGHRRRG